MANRVTQVIAEVVDQSSSPAVRATQVIAEVVDQSSSPAVRATQVFAEVVDQSSSPKALLTQLVAEVVTKPEATPGPSTQDVSEGATSVVLTTPATSVGDVLFAQISFLGGSAINVTPPGGWTLIARDDGASLSQALYYRAVDGSETGTYTWTLDSSQKWAGSITPVHGLKTGNPIDTTGGQANAASTNIDAPDISPTGDTYLLMTFWAQASASAASSNFAAPAGSLKLVDVGTTGGTTNQRISGGAANGSTKSGSTGLQRAISTSGNDSVARNLALRLGSAANRRKKFVLIN